MSEPENPLQGSGNEAAENRTPSEAERRLAEVLRRVAAGDTSVVSEVYWLQNLEREKPPER